MSNQGRELLPEQRAWEDLGAALVEFSELADALNGIGIDLADE